MVRFPFLQVMSDMPAHIPPGVDDGPRTWGEALETARVAAAEGTRDLAGPPHFHSPQAGAPSATNNLGKTQGQLVRFQVLSSHGTQRYLLLELRNTSLPLANEGIFFRSPSRTPVSIVTHPGRHFTYQEIAGGIITGEPCR